ncbi:MAG: RNA 2',3'-cyclic phosphodiesterase [Candidatus Diapherotrites archaeon]|nr:RNA 2',3'-cyclic phosphodiesterase [Candidatus Diapherotrites archaeon]
MAQKRLFVLVNLSTELREKIQKEISSKLPATVKVEPKEKLHITLLFIGFFPEEKIPELVQELEGIAFDEFEISLRGLGEFNNKILWLGIKEGSEKLQTLSSKIQRVAKIQGDKFHAHITLAKNKELKPLQTKKLLTQIDSDFNETLLVKSFELMQSELNAESSEYYVVQSFPLKQKKNGAEFKSVLD